MIGTSDKRVLADGYLEFLAEGKVDSLVRLFAPDGVVISPIYGNKSPIDFFKVLDADTSNSELKFKGFFDEPDSNRFALFFNYGWEMANGNASNFDVVDIFELNEEGKIRTLQIIYNAGQSAALLNQE
ncbi:nuclear transport factor 2 family protein [Croceivirga thetidis]|uniref:Nuclear transport factor 2 family protein n=1 Tax=Croceivirga thetidis TaxID=2721623 RepID=A0ABX1GQK8_9FLAO|nr:nuclear transport factor 2 family protein [Croceivirga thetidis]NKI31361.1 nuclear transport factor 2 family protein [Croceivirga thetidis]